MLAQKNNVTPVRFEVMERVAKSFVENEFSDINAVLDELSSKGNVNNK